MDHSGRLALPYLGAGQMQKHVTVNEALTRLDVLVQCRAISRTVAVPPDDPDEGDLYILPDGGLSGGWSAFSAGDLVRREPGGWLAQEVSDGLMVLVADEGAVLIRRDADWRLLGAMLGEAQGLTRLGLNAVADAGNPMSARLGNALFAAVSDEEGGGEGDLRLTLNKAGPSDVLSLVFQSGWEGRAEMGLVGDDDLVLKVADDDGVWREALRIDRSTACGAFAFGAGRVETIVLTADASWSPPAWARRVEARVVAGGGGGGAGGMAVAVWGADMLAAGLDVVVGAGGAAGDDGQDTTISLEGQPILRALGGEAGGAAGVVAGVGGLGEVAGNSGGRGQTGAGLSGQERTQPFGPGGGGGGGGLSGGLAFDGGPGGQGGLLGAQAAGGSGGVADVGEPGSDPAMELWPWCGGGGGGGAASDTGAGYAGGAGGLGAGGGGGGAGLTTGGPGGAGGGGCVVLTAVG